MKKLAIIFLSVAFTGGVALACPHEDSAATESAPKTAEKAKTNDKAKAKETDKAKTKDTAKTAKPAEKAPAKTDKVSQK